MFPPGLAALITASEFNHIFKGGIYVNDFPTSKITINNVAVSVSEISGVITTISNFYPQEFYYIDTDDREYVSAEMNAFFIYFLAELSCKKINPPSAKTFAGTVMYHTEWVKIAETLNIPVWPIHTINAKAVNNELSQADSFYSCTVIGELITGEKPAEEICRYTRSLQQKLELPYLSCYFAERTAGEYYLTDIQSIPDISIAANREAIVNYFS